MAATVIVRGNIKDTPLLVSKDVKAVEIYDSDDNLVAVMHRVINEDFWGVTTVKDPDWVECLSQLGYITSGKLNKLKED